MKINKKVTICREALVKGNYISHEKITIEDERNKSNIIDSLSDLIIQNMRDIK